MWLDHGMQRNRAPSCGTCRRTEILLLQAWVVNPARGLMQLITQDQQPADDASCSCTALSGWQSDTDQRFLTKLNTCTLHTVNAACALTNAAVASHPLVMQCIPARCVGHGSLQPWTLLFLLKAALQERQQEVGWRAALWPGPAC